MEERDWEDGDPADGAEETEAAVAAATAGEGGVGCAGYAQAAYVQSRPEIAESFYGQSVYKSHMQSASHISDSISISASRRSSRSRRRSDGLHYILCELYYWPTIDVQGASFNRGLSDTVTMLAFPL